MHQVGWRLVNQTMTDCCPTWSIAMSSKQALGSASPLVNDRLMNFSLCMIQQCYFRNIVFYVTATYDLNSLNFPLLCPTPHSGGPTADVELSGKLDARLQPWLASTLAGLNSGVRRENCEMIVGIFNITTQGVLSLHKFQYLMQQITSMAHSHSKSFIAVVVMANRAGDTRVTSSVKQLALSL